MSNLIPFNYKSNQIRVINKGGEPWFVLQDICKALEITNVGNVTARLDIDEKDIHYVDTPGGKQMMVIVNEPGLYNVIIRSDKPEAKQFKRWITHEVLPSIRKTGAYNINRFYIEAAQLIAKTPTSRVEYVINCLECAGLQIRRRKPMLWNEYKATIPNWDLLSDAEKWRIYYEWEAKVRKEG